MHMGMAIGAGIVFLPIKASVMGFWVFLTACLFGYPAMYLFQRLYIQTLVNAPACESFSDAVASYLGQHWARALSILYLCMLCIWAFVYTSAIVHDFAGYLQAYAITETNLSQNALFAEGVIAVLIAIGLLGTSLLFRFSGFMVLSVLTLLLLVAVLMIQQWQFNVIGELPCAPDLFADSIITLPFALTSILFLQSLSPMVVDYRKREKNSEIAAYKAQRSMHVAFLILAVIVFFFAFSFLLVMEHTQVAQATKKNLSALAILAFYYPNNIVTLIWIIIKLFAVVTSFFGVFVALKEALTGFFKPLVPKLAASTAYTYWIMFGLFLVLWGVTQSHFPILSFTSISSPLFAIVGCFMPVMLVYRIPGLAKYRGKYCWVVLLTGIFLVLAPILEALT